MQDIIIFNIWTLVLRYNFLWLVILSPGVAVSIYQHPKPHLRLCQASQAIRVPGLFEMCVQIIARIAWIATSSSRFIDMNKPTNVPISKLNKFRKKQQEG